MTLDQLSLKRLIELVEGAGADPALLRKELNLPDLDDDFPPAGGSSLPLLQQALAEFEADLAQERLLEGAGDATTPRPISTVPRPVSGRRDRTSPLPVDFPALPFPRGVGLKAVEEAARELQVAKKAVAAARGNLGFIHRQRGELVKVGAVGGGGEGVLPFWCLAVPTYLAAVCWRKHAQQAYERAVKTAQVEGEE